MGKTRDLFKKIIVYMCVYIYIYITFVKNSAIIIHIASSGSSLPPLLTSRPFKSSQSAKLGSLCHIATSQKLSFYTWLCIYVDATLSICPTLPFPPLCPQVCSLYLCLHSFAANRVNHYNFSRFHIYVNIH